MLYLLEFHFFFQDFRDSIPTFFISCSINNWTELYHTNTFSLKFESLNKCYTVCLITNPKMIYAYKYSMLSDGLCSPVKSKHVCKLLLY